MLDGYSSESVDIINGTDVSYFTRVIDVSGHRGLSLVSGLLNYF